MMIVLQLQVEQSGEFLMYHYETPKLLHQGSCIVCTRTLFAAASGQVDFDAWRGCFNCRWRRGRFCALTLKMCVRVGWIPTCLCRRWDHMVMTIEGGFTRFGNVDRTSRAESQTRQGFDRQTWD